MSRIIGDVFEISNGNVGLGTNTPLNKLHVVGDSYLNGTITTNNNNINAGTGTITATTFSGTATKVSQDLTVGNYLTGNNYNGASATTWAVDATTAATANKVVARDGFGNIYAGNVGIGTATVRQLLDVQGGNAIVSGNVGIGSTMPVSAIDTTTVRMFNNNVYGSITLARASDGQHLMNITGTGTANQTALQIRNTTGQPTGGAAYELFSGHYWYCNTSSTERMRLDINGNLGIGTTSPRQILDIQNGNAIISGNVGIGTIIPYYKLQVDGNSYLNGTITTNNNNINAGTGTITATTFSGTATQVSQDLTRGTYLTGNNYNGAAATTWAVDATTAATENKIVARDTLSYIYASGVGIGTGVARALLDVEGGEAIISGNVGIGTATPFTKLHVEYTGTSGQYTPAATFINNVGGNINTTGTGLDFSTYAITASQAPSARLSFVDDGGYSARIVFSSKAPGAIGNSLVERLRINTAGYVGIGTGTPRALLDVQGGEAIISGNVGIGTTITTARLHILKTETTGNIMRVDDQASDTTPFMITNDGNVGIGSAAPFTKLDVNGSIQAKNYRAMHWNAQGATSPLATTYYIKVANTTVDAANGNLGGDICITGSLGAYGALQTAYVDLAIGFRGGTVVKGFISTTSSLSTIIGFVDIVVYTEADSTLSVYLKVTNFFTYNIFVSAPFTTVAYNLVESTNITQIAAPTGTLTTASVLSSLSFYNTSGNIGIGTTIPINKLHIEGNSYLNGTITTNNNNINAGTGNIYAGNVGIGTTVARALLDIQGGNAYISGKLGIANLNPIYQLDVTGDINFTGNLLQNGAIFSGGGGGGSSQWSSNLNSDLYYTDGNIGIGTTRALYKLHVDGNSYLNGPITTNNNNINAGSGTVTATTFSGTATKVSQDLVIGSYLTGTNYNGAGTTTWAIDATTAATASKVVARDGFGNIYAANVGIGTTVARALLDVEGGEAIISGNVGIGTNITTARLHILKTETTGNIFRVDDQASDTTPFLIANDGSVGIGTTGGGRATLDVQGSGRYNTTLICIGNVGIGTATTTARLHVFKSETTGDIVRVDDIASDTTPFIIANDGSVGIGTTNPTHKLHIYSSSITDNDYESTGILLDNATQGEAAIAFRNSNVNVLGNIWFMGLNSNSTRFDIGYGTQTTQINDASVDICINTDGNVGIGTTLPRALLDVQGGEAIISGNVGIGTTITTARLHILKTETTGDIIRIDDQASDTTPFLITNDGNVGIGTTNIRSKLHVDYAGTSGQYTTAATFINRTGGTNTGTGLDFCTSAITLSQAPTARISFIDDGNKSTHIIMSSKTPGAIDNSLVERVRINTDGNVGIGTATVRQLLDVQDGNAIISGNVGIGTTIPNYKLHVVGDSYLNGTITTNNNNINAGSGTITATTFSGTATQVSSTLTRGTYLTGSDYNGASPTTWAVDATAAATPSTVVARDSSGDIYANHIGIGTATARQLLDVEGGNIYVSGNIGIGTFTNPTYRLHVAGDMLITGQITTSNLSVIGDYTIMDTVSSNTEQMVITNAGTGPALKVTQTGPQPIADFYDDNSVLALRIADGGNVGIGTTNPTQKLYVDGGILASSIQIGSVTYAHVPTGIIVMWSGSIVSIPNGWALCDGTNSTPDLRNRFIVGAGSTYAVAATGGANTVTLTTANLPNHVHTGTTGGAGGHSHTYTRPPGTAAGGANGNANKPEYPAETLSTSSVADHTHTFSTSATTGANSDSFSILPPYYALAYIMKL